MSGKTHQTAVAVVPPQGVWGPVQAIRERHDRQFRRWPPHVKLLYPYYPPQEFDRGLHPLVDACARIAPFAVTLQEFRSFVQPPPCPLLFTSRFPLPTQFRRQRTIVGRGVPGCRHATIDVPSTWGFYSRLASPVHNGEATAAGPGGVRGRRPAAPAWEATTGGCLKENRT
jgi:hypothetical protein